MRHVMLLALVFCVQRPLCADTVTLRDGTPLPGTVERLVFERKGARKTLAREQFRELRLGPDGDAVRLDDGELVSGRLVSLTVRSEKGVGTHRRDTLASALIAKTEDELRAVYRARKAKIKAGDADAYYALAAWCRENGLKLQAREMATRCLETVPRLELSVLAHSLLGHELKDGKWVDPADPLRRPDDTTVYQKIDPALLRMWNELSAEYRKALAEKTKAARAEIKTTLGEPYEKARTDYQSKKDQLDNMLSQKRELQREIRRDRNRSYSDDDSEDRRRDRLRRNRRQLDRLEARLPKLREASDKATKDYLKTGVAAKSALDKAKSQASARQEKLTVAISRIERILVLNRKLTEAQMRAIFEDAIK